MGLLLFIEFAAIMYGAVVLFVKMRDDLILLGWLVGLGAFIALGWFGFLTDFNNAILRG